MSVYPISEENTINNDNNHISEANNDNDNDNKYPSDNINDDKNIKNNDDSPPDERNCPTRWFYVDPLRFIRIILTIIALILYVTATTKKPFASVSGKFDRTETVESNGVSGTGRAKAEATIELYFVKMNFCVEVNVSATVDKPTNVGNHNAKEEIDKELNKQKKEIDKLNIEKQCKEILFNAIPDVLNFTDKSFDIKEITKKIKKPMEIFHSTVISAGIMIGVILFIFILSIIRTILTDVLGILASIICFFCAFVSLVLGLVVIAITMIPLKSLTGEDETKTNVGTSEPGVKTKIERKNSVAAMLIIAALFLGCVSFCCCICCMCCRKCCCCCCPKESCLDPDDDMKAQLE